MAVDILDEDKPKVKFARTIAQMSARVISENLMQCFRLILWSCATGDSYTSAERFFSYLGRMKGNQYKSLFTSTMHMTKTIRSLGMTERYSTVAPKSGLLHPKSSAFSF